MAESLSLKWGTIKSWDLKSEKSLGIMKRYIDLGSSMSAMAQHDSPEQKTIICELIDAIDGKIMDDWNGGKMSKDEAKRYVMEYGQKKSA